MYKLVSPNSVGVKTYAHSDGGGQQIDSTSTIAITESYSGGIYTITISHSIRSQAWRTSASSNSSSISAHVYLKI